MITKKPLYFLAICLYIVAGNTGIAEPTDVSTDTEAEIPIAANKDGIAIDGYDSVAYFTQKRALKGSPEYSCEWQGKTWLFSSDENRQKFLDDPQRYAPQYGGHCAYAVSKGKLVNASPDAWTVHDEKLYFNVNSKVQAKWRKSLEKNVNQGDREWMQNILNIRF